MRNEQGGQMKLKEIVRDSLTTPDLNKISQIQKNSLVEDLFRVVLNILPYGGAIEKSLDSMRDYQLYNFFRKFAKYLYGISTFSVEERESFFAEVETVAKDDRGSILLEMVDSMDNINKLDIFANLTKARISGDISIEDFFRIHSTLVRIPFPDLAELKKYDKDYYATDGSTEILFVSGAIRMRVIDDLNDNRYVLTPIGRKLLVFGMSETVSLKDNVKGTDLKNSKIAYFEVIK